MVQAFQLLAEEEVENLLDRVLEVDRHLGANIEKLLELANRDQEADQNQDQGPDRDLHLEVLKGKQLELERRLKKLKNGHLPDKKKDLQKRGELTHIAK